MRNSILQAKKIVQNKPKNPMNVQNHSLPKVSSCGYDESTTTNNGHRTRQNCGFFVSQIHPNHGLTTPVIHSEFAVRLISRNKAETIRTNKASRLLAVVETVSPLSSDISVQPFTKLTTMNKSTHTQKGIIAKLTAFPFVLSTEKGVCYA